MSKLFQAWVNSYNEFQLETLVKAWDTIQAANDLGDKPNQEIVDEVFKIEVILKKLSRVLKESDVN
jgi:hypothetical protein